MMPFWISTVRDVPCTCSSVDFSPIRITWNWYEKKGISTTPPWLLRGSFIDCSGRRITSQERIQYIHHVPMWWINLCVPPPTGSFPFPTKVHLPSTRSSSFSSDATFHNHIQSTMATTSTAMIQAFRQQAKNEEEVQDQSKATKPVRS